MRQIDAGAHFALASVYALYKSWGKYPQEIAHIMREILEIEKRCYKEKTQGTTEDE